MKTKLFTLFFALAASVGTMFANGTKIGDLYYNLDATNQTAEVTSRNSSYPYWSTTITTAIIPASVEYNSVTYSVTSIGSNAFKWCSSLTSVSIPNSVTSIGDEAFFSCSSLTSVTIPNSVTSIGDEAFFSCSSLTSVTIPNSVTSIGEEAFRSCSGLTSVTIGNSVTSIGYSAFRDCSSLPVVDNLRYADTYLVEAVDKTLSSYTIKNGTKWIGSSAFSGCSSMTSVTIPNSVTSIGDYAFSNCSSLTSVEIPNSVTSIGQFAFSQCSSLTSVTIGNSVTSIGEEAFYKCSSLPVVDNLRYADTYLVEAVDKTLSSYTIKNGTKWIGSSAFENCSSLTSVTIPNSVTSIGNYAFENCSSLTSVTIPNSVTSIGDYAFMRCSSLTSVTIPNSVTSIGMRAFDNCSSLTSVTIPNSVTSIGDMAFQSCSGLTSVTIPNSVTSIGGSAFWGCSSLTSVTLNSNAIVSQEYSSNSNIFTIFGSQVKEYIIGEGVTSIGDGAFRDCSSLTSVTIPNSVTSIGEKAFENCSSLTSVTIPNSVTSIGDRAFYDCSSLTSVTIPNSVTSIGGSAFWGCSNLTSVTIPNSVTSIGKEAFAWCRSLTSVTVEAGNTVYDSRNNCNAIIETSTNTLIVGCQNTTIPNSVTSIGDGAFGGRSRLTSVTIPNSVTSIGSSAFEYCSSLTSMTIPNSVTSIGSNAFKWCSSLTSVTIPNSVTSIGDWAFYYCSGLTSVTIPNSVTSIGKSAFAGCSSLTAIYVPCGEMERFKQMLNNDSRIIDHAPLPYTITINAINGTVAYPQTTCDDMQLTATPYNGYHFVKWSDGNTDNPRTIELTRDTTFTALFAPNQCTVSLQCDDNQGSVEGAGVFDYLAEVQISATPAYGYHFSSWSDGNTDNPRTIELSQDTTLVAIFAVDKYGTCGDNLQLTWRYDTGSQTLTISGEGDLTTNMRYGVEAVKEMKELVIEDGVGVIGNEAFANIMTLNTITLGKDVRKLQERVFYNCYNLTAIYNYRKTPASATSNTFEEVDKYACTIYVLAGSEDMFRSATGWKDFYSILAIGASETTVTDNKATVEPSDNSATVTWPVSNEAFSYTIEITKDGIVFCRLTFNANGQLTGIAFAPGRDGQSMAPAAVMTANGLQFTVTGLNSNTEYGYMIIAKDAEDTEVASYTGTFTTTGKIATAIDAQQSDIAPRKFIRDNQVLILRDGKTYSIQGVEVK